MTLKNAAIGCLVVGSAILLLLSSGCYTLGPTQQAIVTQFGKPTGDPVIESGLHFKMPFIQKVNRVEKRILEWDGQRNDMPTRDKLYISVDTFGRWRIIEPLVYFTKLRDERSAQSRLEDILGSETRNAVAKHDLIELIRTDKERTPAVDQALEVIAQATAGKIGVLPPIRKGRTKIEEEIKAAARGKLAEFGIELLDIRFKRINYNPSVVEKIYERMISERQQIANLYRSEGEGEAAKIMGNRERELSLVESKAYKEVHTIQGEADARASEIYAGAYTAVPEAAELYAFIKSMDTYRKVLGSTDTIVLSTDSDLFQFLKNANGTAAPPSHPAPDAAGTPAPVPIHGLSGEGANSPGRTVDE